MKKILIIEDDKFLANAYRIKFNEKGFEVYIAKDGNEGEDYLNKIIPDIILLDLVLPGKDGFILLEEIKRNNKWKHIPIIVASNLGQEEDVQAAYKLGAEKYLLKTNHSLEDIVNIIESYVKD